MGSAAESIMWPDLPYDSNLVNSSHTMGGTREHACWIVGDTTRLARPSDDTPLEAGRGDTDRGGSKDSRDRSAAARARHDGHTTTVEIPFPDESFHHLPVRVVAPQLVTRPSQNHRN